MIHSILRIVNGKLMEEKTLQEKVNEVVGEITPEEEKEALTEQDLKEMKKDIGGNKAIGWTRHNELMGEHVTIEDIFKMCKKVADYRLHIGAALIMMYLTGSRISEIIGVTFRGNVKWPGVRIKDIDEFEDNNGQSFLKIRTIIEKHGVNKGSETQYKFKYKYALIPKNEMYSPFIKILEDYSDTISETDPEYPIFNINYNTIYCIVNKIINTNLHIFRHWRATHMSQYHNFTEPDLKKMFGWEKFSPLAANYTHSDEKYIMGKMTSNFYGL